MGFHYVPRRYLANFECPDSPGRIWLYDKRGGPPREASIAKVAQSPDFYTAEDERNLAGLIEAPANPVVAKLLRRERIDGRDRTHLALYIAAMLRRVPHRRRRVYETVVPEVIADTTAEVKSQILMAESAGLIDAELAALRLKQVDAIGEKALSDPPGEIHEHVRSPWPSLAMVEAIYMMTWRVVSAPGPLFFITTDNPAFFFECYGLGQAESEITFPLSTSTCLFGSKQGPAGGLAFLEGTQGLVKEANRRLASTTERIGFYHAKVDWIDQLLQKSAPYLSRIQW